MSTAAESWAAGRTQRDEQTRHPRTSILATLAGIAGRRLPRWKQARRAVLTLSGLAAIDTTIWDSFGRGWGLGAV